MHRILSALVLAVLTAAPVLADPGSALAAALADSRKLAVDAAARTRYLDASAIPADYLEEALRVGDYHVNGLSREADLVRLRRVSPTLLALVLDDYGMSTKVWERFARIDPFYHVQIVVVEQVWWEAGAGYAAGYYPTKTKKAAAAPWLNTKEITELIQRTGSQCPLLRFDWWFVQTARQLSLTNRQTGVGYYDMLGLAKRADLEKLVVLDKSASRRIGREMRAAVAKSGVADQNRAVERLQSLTGGYWVTEDVKDSTGAGNVIRNLDRKDFKHDAEEIYGVLPNGLFVFWLGAADGTRQDSAPDFIGADNSPLRTGNDSRIHVGVSCIRCHREGLRGVDDWVRRTLRAPLGLQSPDYKKFLELKRQYFSDLPGQLDMDNFAYQRVVVSLTGWKTAELSRAYARLWDWYAERPRGVADLASEMGCDEKHFLAALQATAKTGVLDTVLAGLLANPESKIKAVHWEEIAPVAFEIVRRHR